ncbi:hypothetical protein CERSUDRAFT_90065 [Gelatoporia subvermispora B]|uniref:Dolichyl-diphosphooligosaccharide-protein glycosyltransferase subunit OST5 n=1 Tax=Ceriporiopsis subvermispora (strain B) TaxID=914234 RepID=M2RAR0_CERS8|nr:hypothetical protein CERSUDRAFT_90065 [Gelatoporia subvermispora B]
MADYASIEVLHKAVPAFSPYIPVGLLPYIAFILLSATFALGFYFSTSVPAQSIRSPIYNTSTDPPRICSLPKDTLPVRETAVASLASILGGFGVVALFCTVGVYV